MGYIDFTNHFWQLYQIKKGAFDNSGTLSSIAKG